MKRFAFGILLKSLGKGADYISLIVIGGIDICRKVLYASFEVFWALGRYELSTGRNVPQFS